MSKYIKDYDEEKHETRYIKYEVGIPIIVSKDIIIDEYEREIERLNSIIKEVREDLNNTKRLNHHFKDDNGNEYALIDIDHIDYLVKALDKVEED